MSIYEYFTEHHRPVARSKATARPAVTPSPEPAKPPPLFGMPSMSNESRQFVRDILIRENMVWGDLVARDRRLFKVYIRAEIYVFLNNRGWSLTQIGNLFKRDHTTVLHGLRKWREING